MNNLGRETKEIESQSDLLKRQGKLRMNLGKKIFA